MSRSRQDAVATSGFLFDGPASRRLAGFFLIAALLLPASPAGAQAKTRRRVPSDPRAMELRGFYRQALAAYRRRGRRPAALLGRARVLRTLGRRDEALGLLKRSRFAGKYKDAALLLQGSILFDKGLYAQAQTLASSVLARQPNLAGFRILLARALAAQGKKSAAQAQYRRLLADMGSGVIAKDRANNWMYAGLAAWGLKQWQDASDAFERASKLDPNLQDNWLAWAELSTIKYRVDWAADFLGKVLTHNPNHPRGLADMAWVEWYAPRSNHERGRRNAHKALSLDPGNVAALDYLASVAIFDSDFLAAGKLIRKALATNPNDIKTLALEATVAFLTDHRRAFAALERRVQSINPTAGQFYNIVGKFLSRHHRYEDAAAMNRKAIGMDPDDAVALADLGMNLLRIGKYHAGWQALKDAWRRDRYDYRTYNLLTLHDDVEKKYRWFSAGPFRFFVPKDEVSILRRSMPPVLTAAFKRYVRKYGIHPKTPISIELYDKPADFQTRTFGEPAGAGIMGVCFGKVITAMSPSVGKTNWAYVLSHELAHVFHIQMTGGRVPRWFTEGLAEYETMVAKPYWKREYARLLHRMRLAGVMPGILTINERFTHSKNLLGVVLAYYQSSQVIAYIAEKWGFSKIVAALKAYGKGATTKDVVSDILHTTPEAFDRGFNGYLDRHFPIYNRQFDPLTFTVMDQDKLIKRAQSTKATARDKALAACALIENQKPVRAAPLLVAASKEAPNDPQVLFCGAMAMARRNQVGMERSLKKIVETGHDGYEIEMMLGRLALQRRKQDEALAHLKKAARFDPEASSPLVIMAKLAKKRHHPLAAALLLYKLAWIQQTSPSVTYTALKLLARAKKWDKVRRLGPLANHLQPFNPMLHEKYGWALRAAGKHRQALREFESALACHPPNKTWVLMGKAWSLAALGKRKQALVTIEHILDLDSNFMPAVRLKHRLAPETAL